MASHPPLQILAVVQEDRVNASLAILAEKLSRMEALGDQGNGALKDLSAHFAAPGNGLTAGQLQEALAKVSVADFPSSKNLIDSKCPKTV